MGRVGGIEFEGGTDEVSFFEEVGSVGVDTGQEGGVVFCGLEGDVGV